jgi:hypothetical protein
VPTRQSREGGLSGGIELGGSVSQKVLLGAGTTGTIAVSLPGTHTQPVRSATTDIMNLAFLTGPRRT